VTDGFGTQLIARVNWIVGASLSMAQKMVLVVLAQHDGPRGIFPSRATISREAGLSIAAVKRTVKELVAMGLIERTFRYEEDSRENATSLYRVTLPLSLVGSARPHVGSEGTHLGSDRPHRWAQGEPGVGSHRAPEQSDLTAYKEQPIPVPNGTGAKRSRSSKSKEPKQTPVGHKETTDAYFAEFERARQSKPPFGAVEGKAVTQLIERLGGADKAQQCIRNAFADEWWAKTKRGTILDLARADYGRFVGEQRSKANGARVSAIPRQPGRWMGDAEEERQ
jgi:hypothetical protein